MKVRITLALLLVTALGMTGLAQDTYYSIFSYSYFIPEVRIDDQAVSLQQSVLPKLYRERSAARDMRWVTENDSVIVAFWQQQGDTVLHILREFSGIEWQESEFDIYLVRHYPSTGCADPLIIPTGGIGDGTLIEAAPEGNRLVLNLVFHLAKRMLGQADKHADKMKLSISYHPLMQPGPFREDVLAMLLAFNTCQNIIGLDSTLEAYESAFWRQRFAGRDIFEKHFRKNWILSPDQTLADWVVMEPTNSDLVYLTRPPRRIRVSGDASRAVYVEGLPLSGQLGFSVRVGSGNQLVVDNIDIYRLAYACGLRTDDAIRRVDGRLPRNHRALVELILDGLEKGGAVVEISREGRLEEIIIQPILPDALYDDYYYESEEDSLELAPSDTTMPADDEF